MWLLLCGWLGWFGCGWLVWGDFGLILGLLGFLAYCGLCYSSQRFEFGLFPVGRSGFWVLGFGFVGCDSLCLVGDCCGVFALGLAC